MWFDLQDLHSSKDKRDTQGVRCVGGGGAGLQSSWFLFNHLLAIQGGKTAKAKHQEFWSQLPSKGENNI